MATPVAIPYSRSGAALPPRPKQAPRKQLFHKASLLSLFDKKPSAEKWHKQIDDIARGRRPVPEPNDPSDPLPWTVLQSATDQFIRKQKVAEEQRETVLDGLISEHGDKVIAVAACAHLLSSKALLDGLRDFANQPGGNIEDYLQAFVAASHGSRGVFSADDEPWARTMLAVLKVHTTEVPSPLVLDTISIQLAKSPLPSDPTLRSKLFDIIGPYIQKVKTVMNTWSHQQDWVVALPMSRTLAKVEERIGGGSRYLEELLQVEFPTWRSWAAWRPNEDRLRAWQPMSRDWIRPIWTLLGPNFDFVDGVHYTKLSRLILDGGLIAWFESNNLNPGPGLLVNDTQEDMTNFTSRLFEIIDIVCADGGLPATFFWHLWLDDQLGLDQHTLHLWELAQKALFKRAPGFLMAVMQGGPWKDDPTSMISMGLAALDDPAYKELQTYLNDDVRHLVEKSWTDLRSTFLTDLQAENDWLPSGRAVIYFRTTLAKSSWIKSLGIRELNVAMGTLVTAESLARLYELYQALLWPNDALESVARAYVGNVVLGQTIEGDDGLLLVHELLLLWRMSRFESHRSAALRLAQLTAIPAACRRECLATLYNLSGTQIKKLDDAMIGLKYKAAAMCHCTVRLAAVAIWKVPSSKTSWARLARYILETYHLSPKYAVSDRMMAQCSFKKYQKWIRNLQNVFGNTVEDIAEATQWVEKLSEYKNVLDDLQKIPEAQPAMHCIVTAYGAVFADHILEILRSVQQQKDMNRRELMCSLVLSLTDKSLGKEVSETLKLLSSVSDEGFELCKNLVILSQQESVYVAAVQMEVWLSIDLISNDTKKTLRGLAKALRLPPSPQAATAKDYFLKQVASMIKAAHELESMRTSLKRADRMGVATVMTNLGLEDPTSVLEEEIMDLPDELLNFVEQVDEQVVELQFPLSNVKELQRNAMGLKPNESLVVRLITYDNGTWESFCVHTIDPATEWHGMAHNPVQVRLSSPPSRQLCKHNRQTRLGYMIMRCGWRKLRSPKRVSLAEIYREIENAIKTFGDKCIVCNVNVGAHLCRPTLCKQPACRTTYYLSDLHIRLADLHLNPKSVGLLLAALHAAAQTSSTNTTIDLIPNRPDRLDDTQKLLTMLNTIPSIPTLLNTTPDLNHIRAKFSIRHELLFSWILSTTETFLVEATGPLRIPNMPNVTQFVLVDSPPSIVAAFAKHDHIQHRQVLFHGTCIDRLFAILSQGLKVLSGTALQSNGAAYGTGIYLSDDPRTAVDYSRLSNRSNTYSTFIRNHAEFVNKRVLLGIEYAGNDCDRGNGIWVAPDATKLLLRYVFLLPQGFQAPLAGHVVPAMLSNFHTLKVGARRGYS